MSPRSLRLDVWDVRTGRTLHSGGVPVTDGQTLAWIGFSEQGVRGCPFVACVSEYFVCVSVASVRL